MPVRLIECPRDAMQGLEAFVPTFQKVKYLNALLRVGFDTLDFGSFVSPKAVPQMKDTAEVLAQLDLSSTHTRLLAIVANMRGANNAAEHPQITYLGFPLSVSETFQRRNTNQSLDEAFGNVQDMQDLCIRTGKKLVVYLSMGFGNPYGDPYSPSIVADFAGKLAEMQISIISLSDTVGVATPDGISSLFNTLSKTLPGVEFGVHLHARADQAYERIRAAYAAGCRRFDSALRGFGGCPMAKDDLVGNVATETVLQCMKDMGEDLNIHQEALDAAMKESLNIFG